LEFCAPGLNSADTVNKTFRGDVGFGAGRTDIVETCGLIFPPELEMTFMSGSTIGIQLIMPKTGTSPKATPEQQASDREAAAQPVVKAPPPPGMGKIVDKIA
jgi:hypothetical protein